MICPKVLLALSTMKTLCFALLLCGRLTAGQCYDSLQDIEAREQLVQDDQVLRTYILCANTDFQIGSLPSYYGALSSSNPTLLHLRPNIKLQCGDNGAQSNSCRLVNGDVQLEGTNFFGIKHEKRLDNVWLEGLTFVGPRRHYVLMDQPGDIMFLNCDFQVSTLHGIGKHQRAHRTVAGSNEFSHPSQVGLLRPQWK